jgi:hypothetical protein
MEEEFEINLTIDQAEKIVRMLSQAIVKAKAVGPIKVGKLDFGNKVPVIFYLGDENEST